MSTYYVIACDACRLKKHLVTDALSGTGWMKGAETVPDFVRKHAGCKDPDDQPAARVVSEYDWRYDEFPTDDDADGGQPGESSTG